MHHTIVLGGGLAGLTAAAMLARAGGHVTVHEAAPVLGGRGRSTLHDGTAVNFGPHAVYLDGPGTPVLRALGVRLDGVLPPAPHAVVLNGGALRRPLRDELGGAVTGAARAAGALARLAAAAAGAMPDAGTTATAWLDDVLGGHAARPLITGVARVATYGDLLDVQSAQVLVAQLRAARRVRYLHGGWQRLVTQLHERVVAAGGTVRTGAGPARVVADGGRVRGVVDTTGALTPADAVVVATGAPDTAVRALAGTPAAGALAAAAAHVQPARAAVLDVVLARRPSGLHPFVVGVDEPVFMTTPSERADLGGAPGRCVLQLVRYLPLDQRSGAAHRPRMEAVLDLAAPGWRGLVHDARFLPAMQVSADAGLAASGGLTGRVPVTAAGLAGVYLAGDWVGPTGYLASASLVSAAAAARAVRAAARPAAAVAA